MKKIIFILAICSTLCSCGIYTKYKPINSMPDNLNFTDTIFATVDTIDNMGTLKWKEFFSDPQLVQLIEYGLTKNSDLRIAESRVLEAEAILKASKLAYLPSFAVSPQGAVSSFDGAKSTYTYSFPLTASWELDIFGKKRNAKKQSEALLHQSEDYRQAVQTRLIASIANTYYTLLLLDEQLKISIRTEQSWLETVNAMKSLMNAGRTTQAAVSQMEAAYYQVKNSVLDLRQQINQTKNSLALLLALPSSQLPLPKTSSNLLSYPIQNKRLSIGVPIQLLSNRPDVRSAQRSIEAAFYATNMARSAFYPSITLDGSMGWTNSAGSLISNPAKFLTSAIASLVQPLFARGELTAQLKITKERQEQAILNFDQTLLNAAVEVNEALTSYQTALEKSVLQNKQVEALQEAYKSTKLLMEYSDDVTYLEVLTAQQSLLTAELDQIANRFTTIQSLITLYHALGGGEN